MKRALFITICLLPFIVNAQKLLKPDIDKLSGDTIWSTSKEKLYAHGNFLTAQGEAVECSVMRLERSKSKVLILNPQTLNQSGRFGISRGQKAYLKLSDNTNVTLESSTDDFGGGQNNYTGGIALRSRSAVGYYDLSDADIKSLKSATLVFLRIETSAGNFDCDIKPKNAELLRKQITLIDHIK